MSGGASIIVTGVLMTVDSECSVAIASLSEGECSPTQPRTTDTASESTKSAAIIGGVVAIVLIVSVAITITIIAVIFIVKNCHNMSIQK